MGNFYSRPCGRGDYSKFSLASLYGLFLLTPLREGRPGFNSAASGSRHSFLLTPLREGRPCNRNSRCRNLMYFYSRPCGRGDPRLPMLKNSVPNFYSRPCGRGDRCTPCCNRAAPFISTHAPAGGATSDTVNLQESLIFLLTPLREGRPRSAAVRAGIKKYFYSRPCGRGDPGQMVLEGMEEISTHAPAGGATWATSA